VVLRGRIALYVSKPCNHKKRDDPRADKLQMPSQETIEEFQELRFHHEGRFGDKEIESTVIH
jgi:hypothetical protein